MKAHTIEVQRVAVDPITRFAFGIAIIISGLLAMAAISSQLDLGNDTAVTSNTVSSNAALNHPADRGSIDAGDFAAANRPVAYYVESMGEGRLGARAVQGTNFDVTDALGRIGTWTVTAPTVEASLDRADRLTAVRSTHANAALSFANIKFLELNVDLPGGNGAGLGAVRLNEGLEAY